MGSLLPGWDHYGAANIRDNPSAQLRRARTVESASSTIQSRSSLEGSSVGSPEDCSSVLREEKATHDWWRRTPHSYLNEAPKEILHGKGHTFTPLLPLSAGADGRSNQVGVKLQRVNSE
eukprot:CAMPEP_0196590808 /NCGR_PEP_ID=MMETSP1081-20130531/67634_1 /TAXON_ID=36882 /ORGANISM="Pyramimonas amylifera, Strain CCMP720" /LENGTH=118 /DNA_ID=CAMNT_0041914009 /DNA_START=62 /DNA_END=418 /DNA_ORIENTATION=-